MRKLGQGSIKLYKESFPKHYQPEQKQIPAEFQVELPQEYVPLCALKDSFNGQRAIRYLKKRNVAMSQILKHKIGYAESGRYWDRVILPSFNSEGKVNFFTGRSLTNNDFKYLNPETPRGYRNTIIFNELNLDWSRPIFLVEGFMDMLQASDNTVPLFGSTLSETSRLFLDIVTYEPEVYVCLDFDAREKQIQILNSLTSHGISAYDLDVSPYKDVGEMTHKVLTEKKKSARQADRVSLLRERIRRL